MEINKKWITVWQVSKKTDVGYYRGKEKTLHATKKEALGSCEEADLVSCSIVRKKVKNQNYYFNEFQKLKKKA